MKTPRDILFVRHQDAAPKLDAIRRKLVTGLNAADPKAQSRPTGPLAWCLRVSNKLWQELIWPSRRIWAGLAAVWILIFIVNFSQRDGSQSLTAKSMSPPETMMTFHDQQKLLDELFADRSLPVDAERPKIYLPKPRTQIVEFLTT
jgi:hypothetical protein